MSSDITASQRQSRSAKHRTDRTSRYARSRISPYPKEARAKRSEGHGPEIRRADEPSGAVVLHIAPESAVGGPLAIVQDGDMVALDVDKRVIELRISQEEITSRLEAWRKGTPDRGTEEK